MIQGIRDFAPARQNWRERLDRLCTADGRALLPCLKAEIERECRRLWQVIDMIAEVEAEQHQAAEQSSTGATQLSRLRGIGLTIASVLANEVFFRTFHNRRAAIKPSRDRATQGRAKLPSSLPGCGCGTNPRVVWRAGFRSVSAPAKAASAAR
jgi:transposase